MKTIVSAFGLVGLSWLSGCAKKEAAEPIAPVATTGSVVVDVENRVGPDPLVLDTRTYQSPVGELFTVSDFNYYISNIKLKRADGSEYAVPESYFLVRERPIGPIPGNGKRFVLNNIPLGEYTGLSFLIGVDEARNQEGAQTGALSPDNYMFWTWSQGYIFLKLEGRSPASGAGAGGDHLLAYHVGDWRRPNNLRTVAPPLPGGRPLRVRTGHTPAVQLRADVLRLFAGASPELSYPILFGPDWSAVGGPEAGRVANNYSGSNDRDVPGTNSMFTVSAILDN